MPRNFLATLVSLPACRRMFMLGFLGLFAFACLPVAFGNPAMTQSNDSQNPFAASGTDYQRWGPRLQDDAIMPGRDMVEQVGNWSKAAFAGKKTVDYSGTFSLQVIRQDHKELRLDKSCLDTPLKIGSRFFDRGLGTHANSEIHVTFPEPVTRFAAFAGIDNNHDTRGTRGSAQFAVATNGKELVRTRTLSGGDEAFAIDIPLPKNTTVLSLVVEATPDGTRFDQSDWCEPMAVGVSGKTYHLSGARMGEASRPPMTLAIPFSFQYGGASSTELLPDWTFEEKSSDRLNTVYSWTDLKTGLRVSAHVRRFERFAGVDWVLYFENIGAKDTPLLENIKAIDMDFALRHVRKEIDKNNLIVIHTLNGDAEHIYSWLPVEHPFLVGGRMRFAPQGGRSSNGAFPFWNIERARNHDTAPSEGVFVALGWSGQWAADFVRVDRENMRVSAGMEKVATLLHPGEKIRSPRILIMPWESDRLGAHALFRRLLMFEYAPKMRNGLPQQLVLTGQEWSLSTKKPALKKFENQVARARKLREAGCDALWVDATWFPGGFPNGVGNWVSDPELYPQGVEALGKIVHDLGMQFILWFEPERAAKGTQVAEQYPEYVFTGPGRWLFKLNEPDARAFLTELMLARTKQFGVDVFRVDFNISPLNFWRDNDAPNRQGMTEIRYIEGLYEMWNRLRAEIPGLWIDNCASGGRRIDLETVSMSVPLWRTDADGEPGREGWSQRQTLGLGQYIPLFSAGAWESSPYVFRSAATMGAIACFDFLDDGYQAELARDSISEAKIHQKFWYGDFYPLSDARIGQKELVAWQLHRADLSAGLVYIFRNEHSPYESRELQLRAIDPETQYRVTLKLDYSPGEHQVMPGRELSNLKIAIPEKRSALVIQYQLNKGVPIR